MTDRGPISRSENMSRIRSKDTVPELIVRRGLHARGFRFRVDRRDLPGRPDVVLTRWRAVIQVHGCYWHGHDCLGRAPKTNTEYWGPKIAKNRERDARNEVALRNAGWRVLIVWGCCLKGPGRWAADELLDRIAIWVRGNETIGELVGTRPK